MEINFIAAALTGFIGGGIPTSMVSYLIGRRQQIDNLRLDKAFDYAEKIANLIQELHDHEIHLIKWYEANYPGLEVREAANHFRRKHDNKYQFDRISRVAELTAELKHRLRSARLYLNHKDLDLIDNYLDLSYFPYRTDNIGERFFIEFFENLLDNENRTLRENWYCKIKSRLPRIHELENILSPWNLLSKNRKRSLRGLK